MRQADITKGIEVLVTDMPRYSNSFSFSHAIKGTVVATGQTHSYTTQPSFGSGGKHVTKNNGVKVRYEDGTERTHRPEHLHAATGDDLATWQRLQADQADRIRKAEAIGLRRDTVMSDLDKFGIVARWSDGKVVLDLDMAEYLAVLLNNDCAPVNRETP